MAWTTVQRGAAIGALLCAALAASLLIVAPPAAAAPAMPGAETAMVRHINGARVARGLPPLRRNLQLVRHARQWSARMARNGYVSHRPDLASVVYGPYRRLGENVGMARITGTTVHTLVAELHRSFMASRGHRMHVLGRYNLVGVGVFRSRDGTLWMTVNFALGRRDAFPLYRDAGGRAVNRLFLRGAAPPCRAHRFCPRAYATRRQMASMLDRAARTTAASSYVAASCGSLRSCRTWKVTKVDLAVAVARALGLSPVAGRRFSDVGGARAAAVNAVVRAGIMAPCSRTRFCADQLMTRAQLARVAVRALR